jgi:ring-1,2-phenylacetyl-CoA epoxidase subunit PaaD
MLGAMQENMTSEQKIWQALAQVKDPEIPVLSVVDMGIVTKVEERENAVRVVMTPTFVGCPAIDVMKKDIYTAVLSVGFENVVVDVDFETQWNSNLMSETAREKLRKFGIAPPALHEGEVSEAVLNKVRCPHCGSIDTTLNSPFGSTLCRAIRFCFSCKQGFEQFKPVV